MTVGGTGSSLVQTPGEAAQRVHLPEVAVTIETLISLVQIFGPVPVLFRLPVGSRLPVVVTQRSSKGYQLNRITGYRSSLRVQVAVYWLPRITGYRETWSTGYRVLPVTES